jgi:hypothetical protein
MEISSEVAGLIPKSASPFLSSVDTGYDVDIRTPLFEERDRLGVAEEMLDIMTSSGLMFPELDEVERAAFTKLGPMSIRLPFVDREENVKAYYESGREVSFDIAETGVYSHLLTSRHRLRPIGYTQSAQQLPSNTNSGLPLFAKRNTVLEQSVAMATSGKFYPALLGWRGQANGTCTPKQRVVWMFPYATNIAEGRFFRPLHQMLLGLAPFSAWTSMSAVDLAITRMIDSVDRGQFLLSSDFSSYDQTLVTQQAWYFNYLRLIYQEQYDEDISKLENNLAFIPIVCTHNKMFKGRHGVPSGSTLTNQLDTLVNYFAQASSPKVDSFDVDALQVQGDDAVVKVKDVDDHLNYLLDLGFDVNPDKQLIASDKVSYLQRVHFKHYRVNDVSRGVYPIMRALNSLLGQERFHQNWNGDMTSLRALAIMENTSAHPCFHQFVKFVVERGDPRLKEFVSRISSSDKFRNTVVRKASAIPGFIPSYNEVGTLKGLMAFATVDAIMNL